MLQSVLISLALAQSGPVIKDVKVGTGAKAANGDLLTMVYKGTFSNGKVFDENMDKPTFTFTLGAGEVIKGWDKGVLGMKVGGERKLVIPPTLGYGSRTNGPIPANSTLYFDIKLLRVDKPKEKPNLNVTIITPGKGKPAKDGDTVNVLYTGTFLNGVKFDSSYDHKDANGKPSLFPVTIGSAPGCSWLRAGVDRYEGRRKT
jgi:FKBP-type peptidyl-prolyl cis-trans isomerase